MADRGLTADVIACSAAISALAKGQQWQRALLLFSGMPEQELRPNVVTCTAAISACDRGAQWQLALAIFEDAEARQLNPTVVTYNAAISACSRGQQLERALQRLRSMGGNAVSPQVITYNAAISACERSHSWSQALALLGDMKGVGLEPDVITYNALISACEKSQQWEWALASLQEMRARLLGPNLVTCNAVISALEKGEQWERSLALASAMQDAAVLPDVITYSAVISATGKGQQWELSLGLLHEMPGRALAPNLITYNAATSACEKGQQWELALAILRDVEMRRLAPDLITYNAAISACEKGQEWQQAFVLLDRMHEQLLEPDTISFNAAISALGKGGQPERALALLRSMRAAAAEVNIVGYNAAILACCNDQQWRQSLQLLDEMRAAGVQPDSNSVSLLLMECEQRGLAEREVELLLGFASANLASAGGRDLAAACGSAAAVRLASQEGGAERALDLLSEAAGRGWWSRASEALWRSLRGAAVASPFGSGLADGAGVARQLPPKAPYAKELCLLRHVLDCGCPVDPAAVCGAVETFGEEVLGASNLWSKFAGGVKADALVAAVCGAAADGGILEIGTYCGYSALRMAMAAPGVRIATIEVDPTHMVIARNLVILAGLAHLIHVWTGHSKYLLSRLSSSGSSEGGQSPFAAVFMDRWGSQYHEDLAPLEDHGLLQPGALLVADNVLRTGAPLFLWRVAGADAGYATRIVRVPEFALRSADWLSVSVRRSGGLEKGGAPPDALLELHAEAERHRERAFGPGRSVSLAERAAFAERARLCLAQAGIAASADACAGER